MGSIKAPYLFRKRGIFYLRKRIPKELIGQYGRALVQKSLRTSDRNLAVRLSSKIVDALEHEWRQKLFEMPAEQSAFEFFGAGKGWVGAEGMRLLREDGKVGVELMQLEAGDGKKFWAVGAVRLRPQRDDNGIG